MTNSNNNLQRIIPAVACARIAGLLSGREWEAADLDVVAQIVRDAGYEITDISEPSGSVPEPSEEDRADVVSDVDFTITFSSEAQTWMDIVDFLIDREYLVRITLHNGEEIDAVMRSLDRSLTFDSWSKETDEFIARAITVSVDALAALHIY